uniref:UDP-glycosyltransferases domain-containing protein n=2 Tax=Lotharella oceanica TaxID=641309 RepID=A0A7S2XCU5_9EUKA|mmetsp:Transcript_29956/g.55989  ORF Transcript_29956/g.55989 Transcript_29956/m.55989 type:complete len:294 (+) Transcript_29956:516-1397(+)|eukprot:CAMPEP_0170171502 /NCGR_PEP_ID=MMETSP0040_2-20121228/4670_1 /TAXON_ID=641309 /ORGANISM="Lotharella oceanica, Strain CCMP622" /LENGTH=293 /DNA_ID=CAMNT_0010411601 /DNA_START=281 /DNA_END=1162 /DNA_ORIENTATION=-
MHRASLGFSELPRHQDTFASPLVQSTGPWLPRSTGSNLTEEIVSFLTRAEKDDMPVVYLSVGTNAEWSVELARVVIQAFADSIHEFRVVWSIKDYQRQGVLADAGQSVPSNVLMVSWVNQLKLLESPVVKVFITHCGFGSLQEGLWTGTPMLAMPMMLESDQITHAAHIRDFLRVGLSFDARPLQDKITASSLKSKLSALLEDGEANVFARRAAAYSKQMQSLHGRERAAAMVRAVAEGEIADTWVPLEHRLPWWQAMSLDIYGVVGVMVAVVGAVRCACGCYGCFGGKIKVE